MFSSRSVDPIVASPTLYFNLRFLGFSATMANASRMLCFLSPSLTLLSWRGSDPPDPECFWSQPVVPSLPLYIPFHRFLRFSATWWVLPECFAFWGVGRSNPPKPRLQSACLPFSDLHICVFFSVLVAFSFSESICVFFTHLLLLH